MQAELPKIISVDDHVVEPPHLWQTWLPERFKERGPRVERRGIGTMRHVGGGAYEQTFDPEGPKADCWIYEDLVYINKRHVAAIDGRHAFTANLQFRSQFQYESKKQDNRETQAISDGLTILRDRKSTRLNSSH